MMRFVPKALLKRLYNRSSLRNTDTGVRFSIKNLPEPVVEKLRARAPLIIAERFRAECRLVIQVIARTVQDRRHTASIL